MLPTSPANIRQISHEFDVEGADVDLEDEEAVEVGMEGVVPAAHEAVGAVEKGQ